MCFDSRAFLDSVQYVIMFIMSACLAAGGCFECLMLLWRLIDVDC